MSLDGKTAWSKIYFFEPEVAQYQTRDQQFDDFFDFYSSTAAVVATALAALSLFDEIHPAIVVFFAVCHSILCIVAAPVAHNLHHESYMVSEDKDTQIGISSASAILTGDTHVDGVDTRIGASSIVGHFLPFVVYAKHLPTFWD